MSESLIDALDSMYANNELVGYLAVRLVGNHLTPGWLDDSPVRKGFTGALGSKPNQVDYVIPLSITIRTVLDRGISHHDDFGIIIYGASGISDEKLVIAFRVFEDGESVERSFIVFRIKGQTPHEIVRFVLQHEADRLPERTYPEPAIDYIDYLMEHIATSGDSAGFAIRMPSNWANPKSWIPERVSSSGTDNILFKEGRTNDCIILSLLQSNWVVQMVENLLIRDPIAACFYRRGSKLESFFWDGLRNIMACTISGQEDMDEFGALVLNPLWAKSEEITGSPHTIIDDLKDDRLAPIARETHEVTSKEKKILSKIEHILSDIDVYDTLKRVERAEAILSELERLSNKSQEDSPQEIPTHLESRIKETIDRMDALHERLRHLEKRLETLSRDIR